MRGSLKIRQLVFGEQGVSIIVQRSEDNKCFHCAVAELFNNDWLLADFGVADIRLISYFAILEEYTSDHIFLEKIRNSQNLAVETSEPLENAYSQPGLKEGDGVI